VGGGGAGEPAEEVSHAEQHAASTAKLQRVQFCVM
jgi:hypothetical protein